MTSDKERILYFYELIISDISIKGLSLRKACENRISTRTFFNLIDSDETKQQQYARAIQLRADVLAEEIIEISEHTEEDHTAFTGQNVVNRDRLRIDSRKWLLSKLYPRKYGDKIDITTDGKALEQTRNLFPTIDEIKE